MDTLVIKKENPIILNENPLFFSSYESSATSDKAVLNPIGDTSITVQTTLGFVNGVKIIKDFIYFKEEKDSLQFKQIFSQFLMITWSRSLSPVWFLWGDTHCINNTPLIKYVHYTGPLEMMNMLFNLRLAQKKKISGIPKKDSTNQ